MRKLRIPFLFIHRLALKFGIQLVPDHYYSSLSNMNKLRGSKAIWAKKSQLPGVAYDLEEQVKTLHVISSSFKKEYAGNYVFLEGQRRHFGLGFGYIDAQALHCIIRHYKPKRIVEVGSGVSTYCSVKALELNRKETKQQSSMTCIEPYPSEMLRCLQGVQIIPQEVQTVPMQVFLNLEAGDLLFIDSSHTVKPGSDVNYLILEVLPRLKPGVIVHFHDIFLPFDYQRDLLTNYFQRCETSLLRAYLIDNHKTKILFCLSGLHYDRKAALKEVFPEYKPQKDLNGLTDGFYPPFHDEGQEHFPSSIYLQIT